MEIALIAFSSDGLSNKYNINSKEIINFSFQKGMLKRIFWHIFFLTIFLTILYLPVINRIKAVPPGKTYTKVHRIFEDYYYYLSVIRQGRGNWAEVDQYTTEKTNPSRV